jgi:TatD DNase family protein
MLIDTHAHLDFPEFAPDLAGVLARADAAGVTRIVTIGTSVEGSARSLAVAAAHANVFAAVGVHPNAAGETEANFIYELRKLAREPRVVALGEIGLDYHRLPSARSGSESGPLLPALGNEDPLRIEGAIMDGAFKARQAEVFQQQLELAASSGSTSSSTSAMPGKTRSPSCAISPADSAPSSTASGRDRNRRRKSSRSAISSPSPES